MRIDDAEFMRGGGELGALMRAQDWTATGLGPPAQWPQSLKTAIRIMLTSRQPIWIGWGPELIYFYNDAYKSIIGGKHPWALGRPTKVVWSEIWEDIGPMLATATTGEEGTFAEEQLLIMERSGYPEETYYTFSYSPIPDDDGSAGGIICANSEDTGRVIGERQLALLRELAAQTANARTWDRVCEAVGGALGTDPHDITFAILFMVCEDLSGLELAATCRVDRSHPACADGAKSPWPLDDVLKAQGAIEIKDLAARFAEPLPTGAWQIPAQRAALLPAPAAGETGRQGVLVVGLNPYRLFDDDYRGFLTLAAGQISAAFANADAYEQERRRAEKLAELDRAKTTFFSNVSHEFRTPLTLMLGPLEEVLSKSAERVSADDRRLVDVAHRNGMRLMKLVNALLDFSRIEAGRVQAVYRPTDLPTFTAELASSFRSATDKAGLTLTVDVDPLSRTAYVDPEMWEKVVLNLLSNAFKFTLKGGIEVRLRERDGRAELSVRDTGIGIADDELPRLFERFHRVEGANGRSFEGSGIGLALVQELARLHGGEAAVESSLGVGSVFRVTIPLGRDHLPPERVNDDAGDLAVRATGAFLEEALRWTGDAPDDAMTPGILGDATGAGGDRPHGDREARILLADDNADMRDYVRRLLAGRYQVETAGNGREALDSLRRGRPDLLLTDVMMPEMDGFELLHHVRRDEDLRDLPVVMLSARAGEEAQVEGLEAGADDYLVKPFSARELVARVSTTLEMARSRRQAQEALQQLNAQLQAETERLSELFSEAPSLMAVLRGPDHVFELANPAYMNLVGERDIVGKPLRQALPEIADQGFIELLDRVRQTAQPYRGTGVKVRLARSGGDMLEERALDFVYQPIVDGEGEVSGVFVEGTDVTDRVRGETLRIIQNRILEAAVEDTSLAEALDRLVRAVEDLSPTEMRGSVLLLSEDGRFLRHGAAPSLPTAYNEAIDGMAIGPNAGSCGTAAFERRAVYVADIADDPLWVDFRDLALRHGLRACWSTPILSSQGDVLGTFSLHHDQPRKPSPDEMELIAFVTRSASIVIERKRGEQALLELNQSLEQRIAQAVAEREQIEEVLRQAQKMEAVGQLTGGVAHDFNNLLTIITGNMDMALRAIDAEGGNPKLRRSIGNAQKGAERAAALTQRLLAFSRRQPLDPKALDPDRLIAGMAEMLKRALGETVQLETVTAPGLWRVEADPNQLESAILNLAVNARDAMPDGGKLTIETANARLDDAYAAGHAEVPPGDYVVIAVSDTGAGMSRETLARVFEPFFTTKEVGKGTGLGLSMVYGFVKQSGGHVKIYSEVGEGSTVKIYLPRLVGDQGGFDYDEQAAAPAAGSHDETILVVEDDDDVRAYTVEILRELGYRVLEAHDGPAALRLVERLDVQIDLLFTDVVMPAMSGRELSDAARAIRPHLKILYTSGYTRNAIVHGGRLDPGVQIVAKPFTFDTLSAKVREMLDSGTSGRFLLVNHDPAVRMLTAEALVAAGYLVDEAGTAGEAVGMVRASRGHYTAVVIDLDLSGGRGLAKELRALRADLAILLVTDGGQEVAGVADDPFTRTIAKPYHMEALTQALGGLGAAFARPD
ncbi:response regulator [Sphingomonas sp.]|uniref:response regulator n=1 Tax=Sphingomonas sp. TaxID=28214 RepID=UPI003B3AD0D2